MAEIEGESWAVVAEMGAASWAVVAEEEAAAGPVVAEDGDITAGPVVAEDKVATGVSSSDASVPSVPSVRLDASEPSSSLIQNIKGSCNRMSLVCKQLLTFRSLFIPSLFSPRD